MLYFLVPFNPVSCNSCPCVMPLAGPVMYPGGAPYCPGPVGPAVNPAPPMKWPCCCPGNCLISSVARSKPPYSNLFQNHELQCCILVYSLLNAGTIVCILFCAQSLNGGKNLCRAKHIATCSIVGGEGPQCWQRGVQLGTTDGVHAPQAAAHLLQLQFFFIGRPTLCIPTRRCRSRLMLILKRMKAESQAEACKEKFGAQPSYIAFSSDPHLDVATFSLAKLKARRNPWNKTEA